MDCSKCRRGKTDTSKGTNPLIAERNQKNQEIRASAARNLSHDLLYELAPCYSGRYIDIIKSVEVSGGAINPAPVSSFYRKYFFSNPDARYIFLIIVPRTHVTIDYIKVKVNRSVLRTW